METRPQLAQTPPVSSEAVASAGSPPIPDRSVSSRTNLSRLPAVAFLVFAALLMRAPPVPAQQNLSGPRSAAQDPASRFPQEPLSTETLLRARASHLSLAQKVSGQSTALWEPVGPAQVSTSSWNLVTGPITSIAADPSDTTGNTVFLGTGGGGVWKSINAAAAPSAVAFAPLTDDLSVYSSASLSSLSIGAISVQPGGTGVVLAGTGDPNNGPSSWYGAGILRSTDGGNTWALKSTAGGSLSGAGLTYSFAGNAFAGFAWSTTHPDFVVAAVTYSSYGILLGITPSLSVLGLYYSSDAGNTWQLATLEDGSQVFESDQLTQSGGNAVTAVVWNPIRHRFYAAIQYHGYYESLDGITWTRLADQPGANLTPAMCPANPMLPGSPACPLFRGALAVQPVTGDMFALTVDNNDSDQGLWRDVCNLASGACSSSTVHFGTQVADQPLQSVSGDGTIAQAGYDLWLAAVPSQQDTLLFVGTTDIWRCSLANSCAWRNTTNTATCGAAKVAPAQQAVDAAFGANGLLYFGNEGGLWRSTDAVNQQAAPCSGDDAAHFQNLNGGLGSLAQVESFSQDPANASTWLAALGALGTAAPSPDAGPWNQVLDGEGDVTAIDPSDSSNWYATSLSGVGINRCTAGVSCNNADFGNVVIGESQVDNDQQSIPAPWILDPSDTANLILGTCRVWRGPATGIAWSQNNLLSTMLDGNQEPFCNGNAEIRSLAAAPITTTNSGASGSEQLYAGMAGPLDGGGLVPGHVFAATINDGSQANTAWNDRYASPVVNGLTHGAPFNPNGFDVSAIAPDPHDVTGQTIYVALRGITASTTSQALVYLSTDAGAHWSDITANLSPSPANSIAVDPNNANVVYVALDSGVYYTENVSGCTVPGAQCWNIYGSGLPNAPITRLMTFSQGSAQWLRAATWGRGIWQAPLISAGAATTTAVLAPDTLVFSPQPVQTTSAAQTITLTNTGSAALAVSSIAMTGDFTETDNCLLQPIAAGASCQIQVIFAPTQTGGRTGTMTVFANVAGGQTTAVFTGTALPPAAILLSPSSLPFPGVTLGSSSSPQYLTVANTGTQTATLTRETVTGDFSISVNSCSATLAPNDSCTLGVVFTPTASGARTGSLTVTDSLGTQTAMLSGTGQSVATDTLTPLTLAFSAQQIGTTSSPQPLTLTNSGNQPLTSIAVAVSGDFTAANNCGAVLQGQGSCTIAVSYVPTVTGAETGTLTLTDEIHTQIVSLRGAGLAPPGASATPVSINFGGYAVGTTSSAVTVTVTNSGGFPLTGLVASITAGFAIATNNCPSTLGIGAACQIGITFSAAATGTATGTLTVTASNLAPLTVALSGSGEDFSLSVTGSSTAILTSGQTGSFILQLATLPGSTGTVTLACTGAPRNAQCSLNPASLSLTGLNTSSTTVSIATGVTASSELRRTFDWKAAVPALAFLVPLGCIGLRRRRSAWILLLVAALSLSIAGCSVSASAGSGGSGGSGSGGGASGSQTPSGTYTVTVTGTMSNITHTVQLTLIVQ